MAGNKNVNTGKSEALEEIGKAQKLNIRETLFSIQIFLLQRQGRQELLHKICALKVNRRLWPE
jgi:hypothetical protein